MQALDLLSEDELLFQQEIARFAREHVVSRVQRMDEEEKMDPVLISNFFEMGLMGIDVHQKYGGSGGSFFMACLAIEELSKVDPSCGVCVDVQNTLINNIFERWASEEQKEIFFPRLVSKDMGAFCLTEADSGSDAFALKTRAEDKGDVYLLNGKKIFITNANEAKIFIVFANLNPELGYKGITAFIVEKGTSGLSIGKKEKKMGIRASSTCEVILDQVQVSKKMVLGEIGKGYKIAIETLNEGRIGIAAQMLGLATGAYEAAFRYARERSQFGRTINQFQSIQFQLARMYAQIESARLLVYNAARRKDARLDFTRQAAIAKYLVSEIAEQTASSALEIFGGYGFIKEFPAEKFYRDAKIGKLYEGTSNLQLQTIYKSLETNFTS
ncbi:MAG: acyl-CoA dehydrogenase family protein [Oligoflexales bacterium]|nr:acyl-CoA dehydrogenase family protein [Oligoflexales bacterium]